MDQDKKGTIVEEHLTPHSLQEQLEAQHAQLQQEIAQRKRVKEELLKHQEHLEELVEERTAELTASNEQLRQEIAARLQAEAELRVKDSALASSINGIGITDLEGTLIYVNDSLVRMWGYESADEILGRSLPEFWEGEGLLETIKALREKGGRQGEDTGKRKDGSLFPVQFAASIIKDEAGKPVYMFGSFFDITERKKAEEELQKYHQHLEELVEERTVKLKQANEHLQREIAERVQAEESLRESEERATAILNATTDTVSLLDRNGTILAINAVGAERFGKRVDELLGVYAHDLGPPDLTASRRARFETIVDSGKPVRFEDERAGRTFDNSLYPVFDAQGEVAAIAVYARDITERKKGEEALRYQAHLLENVSDAVISTDVEFNIQSWNQAAEEIYGWCADEVIGKPVGDVVQSEWPDRQREEVIEQFLADGHWEGEAIQRRKDGAPVRVLVSVVLLKDDGGNPIGAVSANRDITKRMQAEEALRESEDRYRIVSELTSDFAYAFEVAPDGSLECQWLTEAIAHITGYTGDELASRGGWEALIYPDDISIPLSQLEALLTGQSRTVEYRILCKNGEARWVRDYARPVWDEEQERTIFIHGAIQDITERRQAGEALRESEKLLRAIAANYPAYLSVIEKDDKDLTIGFTSGKEFVKQNLDPGSFDGLRLEDVFGAHAPIVRENYLKAFGGEEVSFELFIDNQYQLYNAVPLYDKHSEVHRILAVVDNITERVRAEELLRENEETARALLNAPTDSAMLIELDGAIIGLNEMMANALGQSPNELVGQNALDFLPSDLARARKAQGDEVVHSGRPVRFQDTRGGRWFDNQIYPVFDAGGQVSRLAIYARDITESRQAEAALQESEEKYRNLVEKINDVIYVLDMEGVVTYVSPAIESFLGYSPPEVVGQPFARFIAPEDLPRIRDNFQQLASGKSPGANEYRVVTKSGEVRWMRTSSQPIVDGDRVTGMRGMLTDITDRKRAEEALRASEQLLQSALDALSANIAVLDDTGTIMTVNASWRTFGDENGLARPDYGVGRNYLAVADSASGDSAEEAQEAARGIRELLSGQRDRYSVEYPCHSPSQERWFIMRATRFESSDGVRVAVSHENISERVRAEGQIEQAAATAERERLARELHDAVTQVLFSASLIADTLPRVWERHPEEAQHGLEELRRLTHGALAEMRTLLLELRPGALSEQELGVLLRQLTDGMMARTRMPVATTVVGDCSLPAEVQIALYRITQEALNNVVKHAEASRATVSLDNEPDRVTLRISDDGRGFDVDAAQPHQMGMKIMHERAQAIGAAIRITSQPGQGTELVVTWTGNGGADDYWTSGR